MCTSRRGDPCHNQQLVKATGGSCEGHCLRALVGLVSQRAHNVLQDTSGWQDCSPQTPGKKREKGEMKEMREITEGG